MSQFLKKILFWVILTALILGMVILINSRIDEKKKENSENNPNQKIPKTPKNNNPPDNPEPIPPTDTENWWLTDEEIEHAYQEIRKEIANSPEIQLVSPSVVQVIQEGGEISEDLKNAKIIFFPINNSENHETADAGSHWTLLVYESNSGIFSNYNSLDYSVTPENAMKAATNFHDKENFPTLLYVVNEEKIPRQNNNSDCGVYVIAYTRALIKKYQEKQAEGQVTISLDEKDLIFTIAEERQKLKAAGFPKKGIPGKDYDIGDDVEYLESEEELISQWWPTPDNPFHQLRKNVRATWGLDIEEKGSLYDHADNFKEFSKKIRLLSGKNLEKEKLQKVYRLKKILKACSLSLAELKKLNLFAGENNFGDKLTAAEKDFIKKNINPEIVKEINDLYKIHFLGK